MNEVFVGKNKDLLKSFADNTFDSIVTDPPYELGFMGKAWDRSGITYDVDMWKEAMRVLKPGGHMLAFGGSRTYHRMVCAVEDAGFEIRDQIIWIYGSGFPKSHNLVDDWKGWGTALKPAHEPIVVARKPFKGTVFLNVKTYGVGALNIDACRVSTTDTLRIGSGAIPCRHSENKARSRQNETSADKRYHKNGNTNFALLPGERSNALGRWPANLIHDGSDEVIEIFPVEAGASAPVKGTEPSSVTKAIYGQINRRMPGSFHNDKGSAARFFYCAKASKSERGEGNTHPTVKPLTLIRYLVKLITPKGGRVLDHFVGSGTTGVACAMDGFDFVGCELLAPHADIARRRIANALIQGLV